MTRKTSRRSFVLSVLATIATVIVVTSPVGAWAQTNPPPATQPKIYKLKGVVKSVDEKGRRLTVAQEDVPGYMGAMTMPYKVGKSEDLKKVNAGDKIQADLVVSQGNVDLENIKLDGAGSGSGSNSGNSKK